MIKFSGHGEPRRVLNQSEGRGEESGRERFQEEGGVSQFGEQEWEMRVQGRRNLHKDSRPGWEATKSSGCRA